jgi:uncharacterized protein YjbJ (UPF0337 family)
MVMFLHRQERRYTQYLKGDASMNSDELAGKWKQLKGSAKQRWGKLTDDDLEVINGQQEVLVGRIQERYGIAKEEAKKQADGWLKTANFHDSSTESSHHAGKG